MGRKGNLITVVLFAAVIFGLGIASFAVKDRVFSENENRFLTQAPDVNSQDILSGKYMDDMNKYVADQFVMRDFFMGASSVFKRIMGMQDIDGVYIADGGYLIPKTEEKDVDWELVGKNTEYVNDFFVKTDMVDAARKVFMIVPTSAIVLEDKLPAYVPEFNQEKLISEIRSGIDGGSVLDVSGALKCMDGQSYYRTDHHWTTYGAFEAYREYSGLYGRNPATGDYEWETVSTDFRGSQYSKVLLPDAAYDEIVIAKGKDGCAVVCDGEPGVLYDYSALDVKDKYNFFLGGNYGRVDIEGKGEGTLLLIKDSFANSFVPFLTDDYGKIIMLDLRYFMGSVKTLVMDEEVTDILVMYNTASFINDKNIVKLGL